MTEGKYPHRETVRGRTATFSSPQLPGQLLRPSPSIAQACRCRASRRSIGQASSMVLASISRRSIVLMVPTITARHAATRLGFSGLILRHDCRSP